MWMVATAMNDPSSRAKPAAAVISKAKRPAPNSSAVARPIRASSLRPAAVQAPIDRGSASRGTVAAINHPLRMPRQLPRMTRMHRSGSASGGQQEHPAGQLRLELCLRVELQQQAGLEKLGIVPCEDRPPAAVTPFVDVLLDQRRVSDCDRLMVAIRLAQGSGVVTDRASNPLQARGKIAGLQIQVRRA